MGFMSEVFSDLMVPQPLSLIAVWKILALWGLCIKHFNLDHCFNTREHTNERIVILDTYQTLRYNKTHLFDRF